MPVIYIDVLFFISFIMDSILLTITGRISGSSPPVLRIVLGGALGGVYGISVFFAPMSFLSAGFIKFVVSAAMMLIVFGKKPVKEFARLLLSFYLSAFLLGGGLSAVFYFSGKPAVMSNGVYYFPLSLFQLLIIALPLAITLSFYFNKSKGRLMSYGKFCTVTVYLGNNKLTGEGIIDTGCSLTDPYLQRPVIIIDPAMAEKLFDGCSPPFRLIPYNTIQADGFMKAFSPDMCIIKTNDKTLQCNCSVALSPSFSGGKIIINPDIFNNSGGNKNELQRTD